MSRRVLRVLVPLIAVLLSVSLVGSASATTLIDIVDAVLVEDGAAVQVTVAVTCDPLGADSQAFLGVNVGQGTHIQPYLFIEGFASYGEIGGASLICDGTPHTYSLTVRPTAAFADKKFRPGPATVEAWVTVCTAVAPGTYQCEQTARSLERFILGS